ncbi:MAG: hypothetical protein VB127_00890 [Sphaerochaeta sp.]|nr:hypothetical protein [Sphaerochaeta sp.]
MRRMGIKAKMALLLLPLLVLLLLFILRSVPHFTIRTIQVTAHQGSGQVPAEVANHLSKLVGTSLFALSLGKEESWLKAYSPVQKASVKRALPSTLVVDLTLIDAWALVQGGEGQAFFLVKGDRLLDLDSRDVPDWQKVVLSIEVPLSYAQMMARHGIDEAFAQVMELARSLEGKTTLITRVKYDNNSSNSFGKMVLELSSLNAQIWVREPVGAHLVQAAILLVQQDQQDALSFLSLPTRRYDLYREGLVQR